MEQRCATLCALYEFVSLSGSLWDSKRARAFDQRGKKNNSRFDLVVDSTKTLHTVIPFLDDTYSFPMPDSGKYPRLRRLYAWPFLEEGERQAGKRRERNRTGRWCWKVNRPIARRRSHRCLEKRQAVCDGSMVPPAPS